MNQAELDEVLEKHKKWRYRRAGGEKACFTYADVSGLDFHKANLAEVSFGRANLQNANLEGTDLTNAIFIEADLTGANLSSALASGTSFIRAVLFDVDLRSANLSSACFLSANLRGASLFNALLTSADLENVDLRSADLSYAALDDANLKYTNFTCAKLWCTNFRDSIFTPAALQTLELSNTIIDDAKVLITYRPTEIFVGEQDIAEKCTGLFREELVDAQTFLDAVKSAKKLLRL